MFVIFKNFQKIGVKKSNSVIMVSIAFKAGFACFLGFTFSNMDKSTVFLKVPMVYCPTPELYLSLETKMTQLFYI